MKARKGAVRSSGEWSLTCFNETGPMKARKGGRSLSSASHRRWSFNETGPMKARKVQAADS